MRASVATPAGGRTGRVVAGALPGPARASVTGLALGAAWGVAARGWMRLVSTEPEFSWAGTLAIVGLGAVFGLLVALSWRARHAKGRRRWLRLVAVPGLLLFAGQGLPFAPAFLVAGPLLRRRHPLARLGVLLCVVGPAVLLWWTGRVDQVHMLAVPQRVQVSMLIGMPLLAAAIAGAGHLVLGPLQGQPRQSVSPDRARSRRRRDSSLEAPAGPA
jgi:hypothetical protein